MWKCPVCDKENNAVPVCPACGYDQTCDYERYPTAFAVTTATPTHTLRRQWQKKQNPPVNGKNRKRTVTVTQEQAAQGCRVTAGYVDGQRLELTVPAGTKDGSVLRCRGMGQPGSNGGRNGDLLVTVRVQEPPEPDGLYDAPKDPPVKGGDLRATVYITPDQAARGCQLRVTPSGGSTHQVTIPGTCTDGRTMRYTSLGQPGSNGGKNGDLILTVRVQQPEPAQQAKQPKLQAQTQQQAQKPKQAQPAPAKAPAAKKSSGLKSHPILVILVILAVFYLFNVYSLVSCKTYGSTVQLRIELSSIAPIRARQLARAESLMETHSFTKIIILGGHADEELMNWLLQQERITKITSLTLIKGKLNDLTPLVDLTQLESLCISNNQISDLTPLAGLTQLRNLDIGDNQISDLTPLAGLTELQSLRMENNQIRSLAGLENLTALYAIYAYGNPLTDTSALEVSGCMDALHMD